MILGYVGPESIAPIASAFAAVIGCLLIGWRWISKKVKAVYRFVFRIKVEEAPEATEKPEPAESDETAKQDPATGATNGTPERKADPAELQQRS